MKILHAENYQDMSCKVANIIAAKITLKPNCVLGLATGSTPEGAYARLIELYCDHTIDFSEVVTINLDEYVGLSDGDAQSYRTFMREKLFDHINIKPENAHVPNGKAKDLSLECRRYEELLFSLGGIDVQLLGVGLNGHIGFNEPADCFPCETHVVDLTESTIDANARFFDKPEQVPKQAISMGIRGIMQAKRIVMGVSGAAKASIIKEAFSGPVTPYVPASILQLHPDFTLVGDREALALL